MALLKSRKLRIGLSVFAALALMVVVGGFALSRGYLIHFALDGQTISRDDFYRNAYAPTDEQIPMYCAPQWTIGWLYVFEDQCFSTENAVKSYMTQRDGSS